MLPVKDRHRPFLEGILYRYDNHLPCRLVRRVQLAFLDGFSDDTVQRLNRIGRVYHFPEVIWVIEQSIEVYRRSRNGLPEGIWHPICQRISLTPITYFIELRTIWTIQSWI